MKPQLITTVVAIACHAIVASAALSPADIQAEIERATKEYLGDFPPGFVIRTRYYTKYSWGGEEFPRADISLKLTVPRPSPSQMLLSRPSSIESFLHP